MRRGTGGVLIVMGVSGSGKSTIAARLADALGWHYQEGDALHSPANVEKMRHGIPLTDADRAPWLQAIAAIVDDWRARGEHGVLTCSALRRAYRGVIIGARPDVGLVYLRGTKAVIADRMASRTGHYMPAALLESQLATLEEPGPDEQPIVVDVEATPEAIVREVIARVKIEGGHA